jgi:predicted dehydrogenase
MNSITRRSFLKSTALGTAAVGLSPRSWAQVAGANEDIRVAVIGFNGQGGGHISTLLGLREKGAHVRITALCDADSRVLEGGANKLAAAGSTVETYTDIRKLLESKNVDAVSIATPNHWHALATIWAIQAGKDVYVEKPVSHNVSEGRRMVEFARRHNRIVQTGTQSRSSIRGIKEAVAWVKAGNLGKIKVSRGLCYKPRGSIGKVDGPQPIPANIDYDLWCGPALKLPLMRKRLHYDWHWVWNTGNGDLGNQGIHEMDVARWFLGAAELSPRIFSVGGRLGYIDDGETPNTLVIYHDYPEAPLIFEVRGLPSKKIDPNAVGPDGKKLKEEMDRYKGAQIGIVIECEGGHVTVPSYNSATAYDKDGQVVKEFRGGEGHHDNWLRAVRSRKMEDLNADILEGHLSSALCHTGNISYRLGAQKSPDEIKEAIQGDKGLAEAFGRMTEHLAANRIDISQEKVTLGLPLKMDPKTERFLGHTKADEYLARPYRPGFVVPAKA